MGEPQRLPRHPHAKAPQKFTASGAARKRVRKLHADSHAACATASLSATPHRRPINDRADPGGNGHPQMGLPRQRRLILSLEARRSRLPLLTPQHRWAAPLGTALPAKHQQGHPVGGSWATRGQASRRGPGRSRQAVCLDKEGEGIRRGHGFPYRPAAQLAPQSLAEATIGCGRSA